MIENNTLYNIDCILGMKNMADNSVDFTLTDIPYDAVNRESNGLRNLDKGKADILTFDLKEFLKEVTRVSKNGLCIWCGYEQFSTIVNHFRQEKGTLRTLIWEKTNPSPMNGQLFYLSGIEMAVWFKKQGAENFNAHCKNTVFRHASGSSKYHPTEKNHNLLKEIMLDNSKEGDIIFDPCVGSGSTLIVAKENGRKFLGFELDEQYYKMALERILQTQEPKKEKSLFDFYPDFYNNSSQEENNIVSKTTETEIANVLFPELENKKNFIRRR